MRCSLRALAGLGLLALLCACPQAEGGSPSGLEASPQVVATPQEGDASGPGGTLTLASWNVRDFFDTVDDPYKDEVPSRAEHQRKLERMALVLDELKADFVGLEEVENLDCLRQLNQALPEPYPEIGLIEGNDTVRGIDVAFLSRVAVSRVVSHRERKMPQGRGVPRGYRFSRDCLEVGLETSPPVTIFVNHFKAQTGNKKDSANKRRAQAAAVAEIVGQVAKAKPEGIEVVLGDLNDEPRSWSLEPLDSVTRDPFTDWPSKLRATHRSRRGNSALDYILVSPDAVERLGRGHVWQGLGRQTSDHDPITLELRFDRVQGEAGEREWDGSSVGSSGGRSRR